MYNTHLYSIDNDSFPLHSTILCKPEITGEYYQPLEMIESSATSGLTFVQRTLWFIQARQFDCRSPRPLARTHPIYHSTPTSVHTLVFGCFLGLSPSAVTLCDAFIRLPSEAGSIPASDTSKLYDVLALRAIQNTPTTNTRSRLP